MKSAASKLLPFLAIGAMMESAPMINSERSRMGSDFSHIPHDNKTIARRKANKAARASRKRNRK